ncbi:MAG: Na+/H+ antiporter NhaC family protein, partial [Pseudomonadota bacterium]
YVAWTGKVHSALARHEQQMQTTVTTDDQEQGGKVRYFLLPLACLTGGIVFFMYYTGEGDVLAGNGASSVFYSVVVSLMVCYALLRADRTATHAALVKQTFDGMAELLPIVTILLLAFAFGACMQQLQAGQFVAGLISSNLPLWLVAPTIFLAGCFISFTTGTSWGTFAILIPVAIPVAVATGLSPSLLLAAVLSGGVFGDHCSPISDSTILSSLASGCDHVVHVDTQLPYALTAGITALLLFTLAGI